METFEGHARFVECLLQALLKASAAGARQYWLVDPDFEGWPLDDGPVLEALTRCLQVSHGHLSVLAEQDEWVVRRHPRFMSWRRTWGHAIDARCTEPGSMRLPSLVLAEGCVAVRLSDRGRWAGSVVEDRVDLHRLHLEIAAFLQRTGAAFHQSTLGL